MATKAEQPGGPNPTTGEVIYLNPKGKELAVTGEELFARHQAILRSLTEEQRRAWEHELLVGSAQNFGKYQSHEDAQRAHFDREAERQNRIRAAELEQNANPGG